MADIRATTCAFPTTASAKSPRKDVAQAVKAHRVFFTTGPFVRMRAGQATSATWSPRPAVTLA